MARLPVDKARLHRLAGRSLARYIRFVHRNSRIVSEPAGAVSYLQAHTPCILAVWHGQFLMTGSVWPLAPFHAMVARHGDAEIYAQALASLGAELIRGAGAGKRQKDRGGAQALRGMLRALGQGHTVAMTADVPPGPARRAGEGIITLARLSGRPIIPMASATTRYTALATWSRMTINAPFGTLATAYGGPIFVPREAGHDELEASRRALEAVLDATTARAYQLAGADPARATPARVIQDVPVPAGTSLTAYGVTTRLAQSAAPLLLGLRERRGREDASRRNERFGRPSIPRPEGPLVWVHAASVGETNAILPLIDALRRDRPDLHFLITTGTVTSANLARRRLGSRDVHQYLPLDGPDFVRSFLDHWRPETAIFTESEIWPNLILETSARGIPLALVNGRMSNRSFGRWKRLRGLSRPLFSRFGIVLTQNEKLARRFSELGARHALSAGNLKIDAPPPPVDETEFHRLRRAVEGRPVLVAASTHDGEEQIVADAHRQLARRLSGFLTIIVPRHPERGRAVAEQLKTAGLTVVQRSTSELPSTSTEIYVADTIGELGTLYPIAPLAFVGGSLVDRGGQNPVEAIRRGAAVLTGPYWSNFADAYRTLLRHRGVVEVRHATDLANAVESLLRDEVEAARMRAAADFALQSLSGALERTAAEIAKLLPRRAEFKCAS